MTKISDTWKEIQSALILPVAMTVENVAMTRCETGTIQFIDGNQTAFIPLNVSIFVLGFMLIIICVCNGLPLMLLSMR